ncbi:MAG: helix-turn-helix domain-containing protein, partial [Candidatus Odinarchaeota archaeon]
ESTYQRWEENKNTPDLERLELIANKLCVSIDWLLGRDNYFVIFNKNRSEILKKIID